MNYSYKNIFFVNRVFFLPSIFTAFWIYLAINNYSLYFSVALCHQNQVVEKLIILHILKIPSGCTIKSPSEN